MNILLVNVAYTAYRTGKRAAGRAIARLKREYSRLVVQVKAVDRALGTGCGCVVVAALSVASPCSGSVAEAVAWKVYGTSGFPSFDVYLMTENAGFECSVDIAAR